MAGTQRLDELGVAEYFVHPRIGWEPKSESIREIAGQLNFAPGTVVTDDARRRRVTYQAGVRRDAPSTMQLVSPDLTKDRTR